MALIQCSECDSKISDKAAACVHCGAPITSEIRADMPPAFDGKTQEFTGSKNALLDLLAKAVIDLGYKLDSMDRDAGLVSFTTGVTWGSWSGVSGTIYLQQKAPGRYAMSGSAKQNVRGGQILAFNIGGEAQGKANKVISRAIELL